MKAHPSINDFQQAIVSFPESQRLIQRDGTIVSAPENPEIIKENRTIIATLRGAMTTEYGPTIAQFSFPAPEAEMDLEENFPLTTFLLKKILRKATNLKEALARHQATFPLPKAASPEICQAYLNAVATYSKQEAEDIAQDINQNNAAETTVTLADDLMTSLFMATSATALEHLGNYITAHPAAVPAAVAAALGTEPHPATVGAFGLTSIIMHSSSHGSAAVALSKELAQAAS